MKLSRIIFSLFLVLVLFLASCIQEESISWLQERPEAVDPIIERAEPYMSKIVFQDIHLRAQAGSVASSCPSGDKECQLNKIYRYVVENFKYYNDPRGSEFIQTPLETMNVTGGDCEDLTILLNSLLENFGIKTYIVLAENHAYSLACDINTQKLWKYVRSDIVSQVSEDMGKTGKYNSVIEDGKLFVINEKKETFVLNAGTRYYYGGDGSEFDSPIESVTIRYNLSSSHPLTINVVPTKNDFELLNQGRQFTHYASCEISNVLQTSDSCGPLTTHGGIVLTNNDFYEDATVDLDTRFYFLYSTREITRNQTIRYYTVKNQTCVVLDATAGKYGYPGYDANVTGEQIAIDALSKEYVYLN